MQNPVHEYLILTEAFFVIAQNWNGPEVLPRCVARHAVALAHRGTLLGSQKEPAIDKHNPGESPGNQAE